VQKDFEVFVSCNLEIKDKERYDKVYTQLESETIVERKESLQKEEVERFWDEDWVTSCSSVLDRANLIKNFDSWVKENTLSEEKEVEMLPGTSARGHSSRIKGSQAKDKKNYITERIEQLYQLLHVQCDMVGKGINRSAKRNSLYSHSVDEHIWDKIRELTTSSFVG
jgi:hypothetical protein